MSVFKSTEKNAREGTGKNSCHWRRQQKPTSWLVSREFPISCGVSASSPKSIAACSAEQPSPHYSRSQRPPGCSSRTFHLRRNVRGGKIRHPFLLFPLLHFYRLKKMKTEPFNSYTVLWTSIMYFPFMALLIDIALGTIQGKERGYCPLRTARYLNMRLQWKTKAYQIQGSF